MVLLASPEPSACLASSEQDGEALQHETELQIGVSASLFSDATRELSQNPDRTPRPSARGLRHHGEEVDPCTSTKTLRVKMRTLHVRVLVGAGQRRARGRLDYGLSLHGGHREVQRCRRSRGPSGQEHVSRPPTGRQTQRQCLWRSERNARKRGKSREARRRITRFPLASVKHSQG